MSDMTGDAARWREIKRHFNEVVLLDGGARAAYLDRVRAEAPDIVADVESLIDWDAQPGGPLDQGVAPAADLAADLPLGTELGPWRLVGVIGRGGMGVVYKAERADAAFRKPAAVKVVRHTSRESRRLLERFHRERETLAGLDHPNIARLLDGGTTPRGEPYLVMEFVDGVPIDAYCDAHALTIAQRLRLFRAVCDAVHYAHQNLVVHRDIKPDNILVAQDGTPKLLDFGVAKLLNQGDAAPADELPRTWLLTPDYASPEQLSGRAVSTASDVYSLGVLLHVLLTGVRPYTLHGSTPGDLQAQLSGVSLRRPSDVVQAGGDAARLAERRAGTPPRLARTLAGDLDAILLKALSPSPAARYASVDQFAADLDRHRTHRPVEARAAGLSYVAGRLVRRHRVALAVAAAMVLVVAAGIAAILWQAALAREAQARAERRFDDVRRLARSFIFDVHDAIVNVPGTTAARSTMVRTAVTYLDSLAREARGDRGLQRELADAFVKVGDAQGHPTSANIGDTAGARASYLRAIEIAGALTAEDPAEVEAARTLAMAHRRLADVLAWGGGLGDALRHAETSRQLFAGLGGAAHASGDDRFQAVVAEIKSAPNTRINDVKVHTVTHQNKTRDVLIITEEKCGPLNGNGTRQKGKGGISLYDVTDPTSPHAIKQIRQASRGLVVLDGLE